MSIADLRERLPGIAETPIIGILRKIPGERLMDLVRMSSQAGLRVIEVTLDSDSALEQIERIATEFDGVTVGAGSVNQSEHVIEAHRAGAQFIVSPVFSTRVAQACAETGLPYFPGAATPTEIQTALDGGALAVKVFPAEQLGGPSFIRAVMSPLGEPLLVPTGGVTLHNAKQYLDAGAVCLGVGSALFHPQPTRKPDPTFKEELRAWIEAVSG